MANIEAAADAFKVKEVVQRMVTGRNPAQLLRQLTNRNELPAHQIALAIAFCDLAGVSDVQYVHSVLMAQKERINSFGERAYPLSEKQIEALVAIICQ